MSDLSVVILENVAYALNEDIGDGDKTTALLRPSTSQAEVVVCQDAILCGRAWFDAVFHQLDPQITIQWFYQDGQAFKSNDCLCQLCGDTQALLSGERTALNFLQTLSATATITADYVKAVSQTRCQILDTRKTLPGLRVAQKYAVRCGGGKNHRQGLGDAILIKENHIMAMGSIDQAIVMAKRQYPNLLIEVEVESLSELEVAILANPDRILLDNFSINDLQQACQLNNHRCQLEASGNITLANIADIAKTGVNFISIGALTKHIQAIDLSMRIKCLTGSG